MREPTDLLERDVEIAAIAAAVAGVRGGEGPLVVIRGAAGIGKTRLIDVARTQAAAAGIAVLEARGGALERDLVLGVVIQLLERRVVEADPAERERLLAGAARLALPALTAAAAPAVDEGALRQGLYWLVANLVDAGPLLLLIDDAHWSDAASLAFLVHLARRRAGLSLILVVAGRTDAPDGAELLDQLAAEPGAVVLRPAPLSPAAASQLLAARAGATLPADAARAGHEVTGGNPFFLGEIGTALRAHATDADAVQLVRSLVPDAVRHALLLRLGGLGADARAVAEALSVLGDDCALDDLAAVSRRPRAVVLDTLHTLAQAGIASPDAVARFVHPIVRTTVHDDLTAATRVLLNERAAAALIAAQAEPDRIAHHLLATEPAGNPDHARALARAGSTALARGDAAIAERLLTRAVAEPPVAAELPDVRFALGRTRLALGDGAGASGELRAALAAETDPDRRVPIAQVLAEALAGAGDISGAVEMLEATASDLAGDPAMRLDVQRVTIALFDPSRTLAAQREMLGFTGLPGDTPAERAALSTAAIAAAFVPSARAADVVAIARRALHDGALIGDPLVPPAAYGPPLYALTLGGDLDAADRELDAVLVRARARGSSIDFLTHEVMRLDTCRQRGDLAQAAAYGTSAVRLARDWGDSAVALRVLSVAILWLADVLVEQDKLDLAAALVRDQAADHDLTARPELAWVRQARGIVALAQGRSGEALEDLLAVGATARAVGYEDRTASWRPWAARAAAATGDTAAALALTAEELELCRTWGAPGPLATALRTHAMLGPTEAADALLREAQAALVGAGLRAESARVDAALGLVFRRDGRRTEARELLERAADAATACGATATAERAREELVILGARPRRLRTSGVDALTASERRVADLAAAGLTNREIAQELFVTMKTVETHLRQAYRKLDVPGRDGLSAALSA